MSVVLGLVCIHTVTLYNYREIMFHVSTLLPYTTGDAQQVSRGINNSWDFER